jgi:cardiolipin synthase
MKRPVVVAVPVTQTHCRAYLDYSRDWSVIEDAVLLMLALGKEASRVEDIAAAASLRHQVVVAALSRLMRFRLVEISTNDKGAAFVASQVGLSLALDGRPLPRLPQEVLQRFSFGVDLVCGSCFNAYDARIFPRGAIEAGRQQGANIRILETTGGDAPSISESSTSTLYDLLERGGERRLLRLATNETVFLRNRFMRLTVSGTTVRHFPSGASEDLRLRVLEAAGSVRVQPIQPYAKPAAAAVGMPISCNFDPVDVIVGGPVQSDLLDLVVGAAKSRLIIHSTFLSPQRFEALYEQLARAVIRGVTVDLLWGAAELGGSHTGNLANASQIGRLIKADTTLRGRVRMRMRTSGSHAKILLADQEDGTWLSVVSSCNWLSTGFKRAELSVVLRSQPAVAACMDLLRTVLGQSSLTDGLVDELRIQANDLRRQKGESGEGSGNATVIVVAGQAHDAIMRVASGTGPRRLVIGSDRLGATAWTGALIPGELVKELSGGAVVILYRRPSGPVKNRAATVSERRDGC